MKTKKLFSTVFFVLTIALVISCKDDESNRLTLPDIQDLSEEAITDSYFQDLDDMAGVALQSDDATNGGRLLSDGKVASKREITIQDDRFKCNGILITIEETEGSTLQSPKGKINVDFGTTGCSDVRGNKRTGKLIFTYSGRRFAPGSTVITTAENYTINGIKLEGIRTLTNVSTSTHDAPEFNVVLENGKATFENGAVATRESDITVKWIRTTSPTDDNLIISANSHAEGETRGGRNYKVTILEPLEFKRFCGVAVSGVKKYVIDEEKDITIDYGDGSCDRKFVITVNGTTRELSVN